MLPETDASQYIESPCPPDEKPEPLAINLSFPGHNLQVDVTPSGCFPFNVWGTACLGCNRETQPKIQPQTWAKLVQAPGMLGQTVVKTLMGKTQLHLHLQLLPCSGSSAQLILGRPGKGTTTTGTK